MARKRGGYQRPSRPAAVSGPGALSQRTDGQPVRVAPGGDYGSRQEMESLQQAAPMAAGGGPAGATAAGGVPPVPLPDIFAPSQGGPIRDEGTPAGAPPDPYAFIAAAYSVYPDPALAALLQRRR